MWLKKCFSYANVGLERYMVSCWGSWCWCARFVRSEMVTWGNVWDATDLLAWSIGFGAEIQSVALIIEYASSVNVRVVLRCGGQRTQNLYGCAKTAPKKQGIVKILCAIFVENITKVYVREGHVTGECVKKIIFGVQWGVALTVIVVTVMKIRPAIFRKLKAFGLVEGVANPGRHRLTQRPKILRNITINTGSVVNPGRHRLTQRLQIPRNISINAESVAKLSSSISGKHFRGMQAYCKVSVSFLWLTHGMHTLL